MRRLVMRRKLLGSGLVLAAPSAFAADSTVAAREPFAYAPVTPGTALAFPRDFGAHPQHRIEWWYVTGWLDRSEGKTTKNEAQCGFQVTFFRVRTPLLDGKSAFTPTQLLFAHAAISDARVGKNLVAERSARTGFGLAGASQSTTDVWIRDWRLTRSIDTPTASYTARIRADAFAFDLTLNATQTMLLQGDAGFSQKGPSHQNASQYYSLPQLQVRGTLSTSDRKEAVRGVAWLDHEWSSALMPQGGQGWDWVGINFDDGAALMAFQLRSKPGTAPIWRAARWRKADGSIAPIARESIQWRALRNWTSPETNTAYPVEMELRVGNRVLQLKPLFDAQELVSHGMGNTYWEGAVHALDAGQAIGRGYLELTGYGRALRI